MRPGLLLVLCGLCLAQERPAPQPGLIDPRTVRLPELDRTPREGTAREALAAFLDAHRRHQRGDLDGALQGYLRFPSIRQSEELPARYRRLAAGRTRKLLADLARDYDAACALYRKDRARGLAALRRIAARGHGLPQVEAAAVLVQSDALLQSIEQARALLRQEQPAEGVAPLEAAILKNPRALHRFAAKRLLRGMGGPDLFTPEERELLGEGGSRKERGEGKKKKEEEEETVLEEHDDED
ncbi:MAG: hypothetical protein ACE5JG_05490 [Planctomycetota bacterium]